MSNELTEKIREYIARRCRDRLEKLDKEAEKARGTLTSEEAVAVFNLDYAAKRQAEVEKYQPANWLSDAASRAKQISLVSHALKFTHSDAKGSSLLVGAGGRGEYLCTARLQDIYTDVVGNAAALDVANLLLLQVGEMRLLDCIAINNPEPLAVLATDEGQLAQWMAGFAEALKISEPASHTLAKQVYFPVGEGRYHLLAPLASSALTQALYARITNSRFGEEAKMVREAKRKSLYHSGIVMDFPNLATQSFGGTKPQNISLLNSQRRGRAFLLSCQPPVWANRLTPPKTSASFWARYRYQVRANIRELKSFLELVAEQDSTIRIRHHRAGLVQQLVDELHQYAARFWQLPPGWSCDSDLSMDEACWLDPARTDSQFTVRREAGDWPKSIGDRFATLISGSLNSDKLPMSDVEHSHFNDQIQTEHKRLVRDLEALI
ncbi:type I-F CRISPR-associated protein Csy1 [Oceanobacter antarcticus]|uniref:Type I-F CRISPR-associated protein Csy1 n=1 Tax=Oceanobacter antarcticus TaxID=3133425 RepID=A0ABW8NFV2_9GAMM